MRIFWIDHEREPRSPTNPDFPNGIHLDLSTGAKKTCTVVLPYPAKRCGFYYVECEKCGTNGVITTAGRPDDPRSAKIACKKEKQ